jgi:hypothetical protein
MNLTIIDYKEIVHSVYKQSLILMTTDIQTKQVFVGVDPGGRHQGVSVYVGNMVFINQIDFRLEKNPVQSMLNIMESIKDCILPHKGDIETSLAVVEGASYGERFGQVSLSESRAAAMIILNNLGFQVTKIPPTKVRFLALGNGKEKGEKFFDFPHDALASFLCCLAAVRLLDTDHLYKEVLLMPSQ